MPPPDDAPSPPQPPPLAEAFAIGVGGAIGTLMRTGIQSLGISPATTIDGPGAFPFVEPILVANVLGAAGLGFLLGWLAGQRSHPLVRPFLGVGLLGSFTTWSSLVAETGQTAMARDPESALVKLGGSLVLGILAFVLGERAGRGRPSESTEGRTA